MKEFNCKYKNEKISAIKIKNKQNKYHFYTLDDGDYENNNISILFASLFFTFCENPSKIFPFLDVEHECDKVQQEIIVLGNDSQAKTEVRDNSSNRAIDSSYSNEEEENEENKETEDLSLDLESYDGI
ncbi:hypothetical protein WA158_006903 [Blastocystis sp. Blastoise]